MNKKFSTLMAGLLLAGGVTTANAQVAATSDAIASITEGAVYVLAVNVGGAAPSMTNGYLDMTTTTGFWQTTGGNATLTSANQIPNSAKWTIKKVMQNGAPNGYYEFTDLNGNKLAFNGDLDGDGAYTSTGELAYNAAGALSQFQVSAGTNGHPVVYISGIGHVAGKSLMSSQWDFAFFRLDDESMSADDLNAYMSGGFQLSFKKAADLKKDQTFASNVFTENTITAVDYNGNLLLRVAGSYAGTTIIPNNTNETNVALINQFRASQFIAVDTVKYNSGNNTYRYVVVPGSDLMDAKGNVDGATVKRHTDNIRFKVTKLNATKPRFTIESAVGYRVATAGNTTGALGQTPITGTNQYVTVFDFNGANYVGTGDGARAFITYGATGTAVSGKTFAGKAVSVQMYGTGANPEKDMAFSAYGTLLNSLVDATVPEGQFLQKFVPGPNGAADEYWFVNREKPSKVYIYTNLHKSGDLYIGVPKGETQADTLVITPAPARADIYAGFKTFTADEQTKKVYNISVVAELFGNAYLTEPEKDLVSLSTEYENAGEWIFTEKTGSKDPFGQPLCDIVYRVADYNVWDADEEKYVEKKDTVAAKMYSIKNAATGKGLKWNNTTNVYDVTGEDLFVLKEKFGKLNIIPATKVISSTNPANFVDEKLFGAFSESKVSKGDIKADINKNDKFEVSEIKDLYFNLGELAMDTVVIYRADNENVILYERNEDTAVKDSINFLGIQHIADVPEMKPAMFVDTAYVRGETLMPQYMFVVGSPVITNQKVACSDPTHEAHYIDAIESIAGRYLVDLADSADVYKKTIRNPYKYDGYNRLGFVNAIHTGDKLIVANDKKEIKLNEGLTVASFALRVVDEYEGTFNLQTKNGYVKYLNGAVVVVGNKEQADVFSLDKTSEAPTANEAVAAAEVSVVAVNGAIIVKGAAGKVVTVANILGQTIANQVAASDNVTIAAPAGIAVVTVDGEATKVVVK